MLKWLLTLALMVVLFGIVSSGLNRRGAKRLPGDIKVRRGLREFYFPFASVLVFSLLFSLILYLTAR